MNTLTARAKPISKILKSTIYIALFSTSTSPVSSALSTQQSHSSLRRRQEEEESRSVRVSVWWDIENCTVPNGVNVFKIASYITAAVRSNGIKGPVQVTAFGDVMCLSRTNQEALSSTGVNLIHIPNGVKNSADRSLLVDLMYWVSQNPPPAHIFLISGDRDFAGILHKLRMSNYNVLLAAREGKQTSGVLCSAASIMWHWNELAKGENLSGRHFNQPPDGPFNSWYGHYRGALEDPYAVSEPQNASEAHDSSKGEPQHRPVPMAVLRQLRRVVNSYPEGLTITELRSQLQKQKVPIDRNIYGYKKFSEFLIAMPRIVKVESRPDGQFFLRPASRIASKSVETDDGSSDSMAVNSNRDVLETIKENVQTRSITRMEVRPLSPMPQSVGEKAEIVEKTPEKKPLDAAREDLITSNRDLKGEDSPNTKSSTEEQNSKVENGIFRRFWAKLFIRSEDAIVTNDESHDRLNNSSPSPGKSTVQEELSKSNHQIDVHGPAQSSSATVYNPDAKSDIVDKSEANTGFIAQLIRWFRPWRKELSGDRPIELSNEGPSGVQEGFGTSDASHLQKSDDDISKKNLDDVASQQNKLELFSKETFWSSLRAFLRSHRGSEIVFHSTSRVEFAERLQKEGPLVLLPLQANDMLHLVDLLVSEKKWIKEMLTRNPRFALVHLSEKNSTSAQTHNSTGLSSIFVGSTAHEIPLLRVSSIVQKKPAEKSRIRSEILADCQKLLDEILPKHHEGFNIGCFKKLFLERYGYALDHQKLGYPKLVSLLQIMPGVKVVSGHVFTDSVIYAPGIKSLGTKEKPASSDSEFSDSSQKDEDVESQWEELGPISRSNGKQGAKASPGNADGEYEPSLSGDEFSDVEEEEISSSQVKAEGQNIPKVNEEDSSLLQILDSWYSTNESSPRDPPSNPEGLTDCSDEDTRSSELMHVSEEAEAASTVNKARKLQPPKSYRFVSEPLETKKDKLIDGILGSLKKSGEPKIQG